MKLRNISRWKLDESTQGLLYFAQRLDELLFDYTLDTYKPAALNAPSLCVEAIEVITEIQKGSIEASNLEPILEELVWSVRSDPVAKKLLSAGIDYYTLNNEKTPLALTKLRLEVLSRTINSDRYLKELVAQLERDVVANKKRSIDLLTSNLITTLVNRGVTKRWLHDRTHDFFFSPNGEQIDSTSHLQKFIELVNQKTHKFIVHCVVSDLVRSVEDSVRAFGITILDEAPAGMAEALASNPLGIDEVIVKVEKIEAYDPYAARELAFRRLDNLSDLFTLFYHRKRIAWRQEAQVIWSCCTFEPTFCGAAKGPMEKAFDLGEERAAKQLSGMLNKFAAKRDRDSFRRFNRVADLHGICVEHNIPENQLVNLWTALETLVPSHVGGSRIRQVVSGVIPFVCLRYIERIIERAMFDLLIWDKWRAKKVLNKVPLPRGSSLVERMAVLLVDPECQLLRDELYGRLGDFHLLRRRLHSISSEFSSAENVLKRLDLHEKKVRWQLRRLYRARNLIVHTSRSPSYINTLIENGHDYLDSIMFEVIRCSCSDYQTTTIEQTFELTEISYLALRRVIAEVGGFAEGRGVQLVRTGTI